MFTGEGTMFKGCSSVVLSPSIEEGPAGHCWRALASTVNSPVLKTGLSQDAESLLFQLAGKKREDQVDIISLQKQQKGLPFPRWRVRGFRIEVDLYLSAWPGRAF